MNINKRQFLKATGLMAAASPLLACTATRDALEKMPQLQSITGDVNNIGVPERQARVAKAQALLAQYDIDALLLEPGSAMSYFTGISWWRSERLTAVVIPAEGDISVITPFFEEPSVRESMSFGDDVRTWHEHENPFALVVAALNDRGIVSGRIALEDTVRYFVADGLQQAAPGFATVSATPVTRGCRMYKSENELKLMHKASEVTLKAYEWVHAQVTVGMTGTQIKTLMNHAQATLGGSNSWSMALVGPASAYPHGTDQEKAIEKGDIVLMDCGCQVNGYQSDISRTFVVGTPDTLQRKVWNEVRKGQQIAFDTATVGTAAGLVDDAVRAWYETLGYGPGYRTPGLSHRTGHGIGMDGHEPVNFVHGESTPLAPGMCFSNEPGIYDFNTFGVRLEDCLYMSRSGPVWFTVPPDSIDEPLGTLGPAITVA